MRIAVNSAIPGVAAEAAWASHNFPAQSFGRMPTYSALRTIVKDLHASELLFGSAPWHTRSIWVNAGPKTILIAAVNVFVFDVASGKVVYKKSGVVGRSDEKSVIYKLALDVLLSPLVTAVSGGPATPQEQRAVQIALGLAYRNWVRPGASK